MPNYRHVKRARPYLTQFTGWKYLPLEIKQQIIGAYLDAYLEPYFASFDKPGTADCFNYHEHFLRCARVLADVSFVFASEALVPLRNARARLQCMYGDLMFEKEYLISKDSLWLVESLHDIFGTRRDHRRAKGRVSAEMKRLKDCQISLTRTLDETKVRQVYRNPTYQPLLLNYKCLPSDRPENMPFVLRPNEKVASEYFRSERALRIYLTRALYWDHKGLGWGERWDARWDDPDPEPNPLYSTSYYGWGMR